MEHLESIVFAAFVGAVAFYILNHTVESKITQSDGDAIKYGAAIGATTQLIMRITGVS